MSAFVQPCFAVLVHMLPLITNSSPSTQTSNM